MKTKPVVIPVETVAIPVSISDLISLPVGASYEAQSGRAQGKVTRNDPDTLTFTANCDSLMLLVEEITKEVYHLSTENTALKTSLNEIKTTEVNKLTGLQWFQVWVGRIALILLIGIILTRKIKWLKN